MLSDGLYCGDDVLATWRSPLQVHDKLIISVCPVPTSDGDILCANSVPHSCWKQTDISHLGIFPQLPYPEALTQLPCGLAELPAPLVKEVTMEVPLTAQQPQCKETKASSF